MQLAAAALDVVILAAIYLAVAKDEITRERTATDEMWDRPLSWWTHRNEKPAAVDAATGRESSRSGLRPVRQENVTRALWN
jgi:hypothetical protein